MVGIYWFSYALNEDMAKAEARKRFIDLRLQQDLEIRKLYIKLTKNISDELKKEGLSKFNKTKLQHMYSVLKKQEELLN